jgi:hypothetical protein
MISKKTNMVFGCSPYRGDIETNVAKARQYARFIALCGYSPVMPHLMFPQFLDDSKADERIKGIELGIVQMKQCDEMWIFGTTISKGMEYEISMAKGLNIVVRMFDEDCKEISPVTLKIDDRVDFEFRRIVNGLKFV